MDTYVNYARIENYGIVGAMRNCALINKKNASVDFMCYPDFDSGTIFGRLLDSKKGGFWEISIAEEYDGKSWEDIAPPDIEQKILHHSLPQLSFPKRHWSSTDTPGKTHRFSRKMKHKQMYFPNSNILMTRYNGTGSISQVVDFMPVIQKHMSRFLRVPFQRNTCDNTPRSKKDDGVTNHEGCFAGGTWNTRDVRDEDIAVPCLIRKFEVIRGQIRMRMICRPHFDYARQLHRVELSDSRVLFVCDTLHTTMELTWYSNRVDEKRSTAPLTYKIHKKDTTFPGIFCEFELLEGDVLTFLFRQIPYNENQAKQPRFVLHTFPTTCDGMEDLLNETLSYWHTWLRKCKYDGSYRSVVTRSALLLKLMTYYPTGAIIAAATFAIPEEIGGKLNWDYRFTWIRDASFTIYAFLRLGLKEEANAFMKWIEDRCREMKEVESNLSILYDVRGFPPNKMITEYYSRSPVKSQIEKHTQFEEHNKQSNTKNQEELHQQKDANTKIQEEPPKQKTPLQHGEEKQEEDSLYERESDEEAILTHLEGYLGSQPIRIGNGAVHQLQLDIYGELMDSIYLIDKHCAPLSYDFWLFIKDLLVPIVIRRWSEPDYSIWEFRHGKQHYTYSKIMCWVALDRAIRLANKHSFPAPDRVMWQQVRDEIYMEVMEKGYDPERRVFTQFYGSQELDASTLIMPLVFFMPANDPRFLGTLEAIMKKPKEGGLTINHLCFRTSQFNTTQAKNSGTTTACKDATYLQNEGTFNLCTFWLIEALSRTKDNEHLKTAEFMFEDITSFANHLGLFSEEISVCGQATGNFPQAFTHLALISAAYSLDRALDSTY